MTTQEKDRQKLNRDQKKAIEKGWAHTPAEEAVKGASDAVKSYLKNKGKKDPLGGKAV